MGSSIAAESAWLSFATIGAGVPLGAERPYQTVSLKSGSPASVVVGTFGSIAEREAPVTEYGLSDPAFACSTMLTIWLHRKSTLPASTSWVACGVPRYDT